MAASSRGELLALQRDSVYLNDKPDERGFWGTISLRRGLKRTARKRDIPITEDMAAVLTPSERNPSVHMCSPVCLTIRSHSRPIHWRISTAPSRQHATSTRMLGFTHCATALLTEAGRQTQNVRALQRLAGHSRIEATMRYVHPDQEDVLEIAARVQVARTERTQTSPATVSATSNEQQSSKQLKFVRCRI